MMGNISTRLIRTLKISLLNYDITYRMRGYTFIETLVVLALVGIMSFVALTQFSAIDNEAQDGTAVQLFMTDVARARMEATARGGRMILKQASPANAYTAGIDYPPYSSTFVADTNIFTRRLPTNMTIQFPAALVFDPRGFVVDTNGNLTTSTATIYRGSQGVRAFIISAMGGVS